MNRQTETLMPTKWGNFRLLAYADAADDAMPHLAMVHEDFNPDIPVLMRIHSECLTGDVFGSRRCDCGQQLSKSLELTAAAGGVVIYLRQEGRGIGLINKLKAYRLQDNGLNTADANTHLGFEVDARSYEAAIAIMLDLGITQIQLLTNNPLKVKALEGSPIRVVQRVPLIIEPQEDNEYYLQTKKDVMGHWLK
jgi:GTP cyclohydrolase II